MEVFRSLTLTDGAIAHYGVTQEASQHRAIVLLHGLASNATRWSEFVERTTLKHDWNLLRVDLRGHGGSMFHGQIGHARWCKDLHELLSAEGYSEALFVGHSLGAQLALHFTRIYPAMVRGLVLIDAVFPTALHGTLRTVKRLHPLIRSAIPVLHLLKRIGLGRREFPTRDMRALDEHTRATLAANPGADLAELYMSPSDDLRYLPLANYLQDLDATVRPLPPLERIEVPVLALLSAGGSVTRLDETKRQIARFPHAAVEMIDADHWPLTERPEEVREAIERWVREEFEGTGVRGEE